jgi:ribosomal protein S18 acetylase RimI-like enzyme
VNDVYTGTTVRDAGPQDNQALVALAARCSMAGDVSLCVHRHPDFFALSRIAGDPWRVGVVDGDHGPVGCVAVARRHVYVNGSPSDIAYVGDLKVHPAHRRQGVARALAAWAQAGIRDLVGSDGLALGTVLAGNAAADSLLRRLRPPPRRQATIRSYHITLLWRRTLPGGLVVRPARPDDLPDMVRLWRRLAAGRQFAPVAESFSLTTPGLDYLVAHQAEGELAGFVGLWDQHEFKQMRVTGYSPRLALTRAAFNTLAPLVGAPRLPPPGGPLRYRTVLNPCVPDADTLRILLRHGCERLRGDYSFLTIGLDAQDPLTRAVSGLVAPATDVAVLVHGRESGSVDDRPLHFEIAAV